MSILEEVKIIVAKQLDQEVEGFDEYTDLEEAGYESLDVIETVFAIEEKFDIDIPLNANDADSLKMRTIGDIVTVVEEALAKKAAK